MSFKGIVHPEMKMFLLTPRASKMYVTVSSVEHK